jgi:hypothetical protein
MRSVLKLFTQWGISFDKEYTMPEAPPRKVEYADRLEIEHAVLRRYPQPDIALPDDDFDDDDEPPVPPPRKKPPARNRGKIVPPANVANVQNFIEGLAADRFNK